LDAALRQLVSIRDTGYKLIVAHSTFNAGICASLINPTVTTALKPHAFLVYGAIVAFWLVFSWWQVSLYLTARRMNVLFDQCLAALAKTDMRIPPKGPWVTRRRVPALLIPVISALTALVWSVLRLAA